MFSPPNITAFKQKEIGNKGTLFNTSNERITTDTEAKAVENRVKILKKEEDRMMKKINEARNAATKMA